MIFSRYIVHHFDLSGEVEPIHDAGDAAHYCVFWYGSVPLGEVYFALHDRITVRGFWKACVTAITPSLGQHLSKNNGCTPVPLDLEPDPIHIRRMCHEVVGALQAGAVTACNVSVVICTRNRAASLRRCLAFLQIQHCKPLEVIVVDNGSESDDTRFAADAFGARYIREDVAGLDVARNTGARAAKGSIIAYTDDDTQPDPYWVYRIMEAFKDQRIAAMTGLIITASLNTEAEVIFEKFWPFNRGYLEKTFDDQFFRASLNNGPPVWQIGAGANMAFRKFIFEEVGYFDERLDVGAAGCSGDSELWYRILACGFSIRYCPMAVVYHQHRQSIQGLRKQLYGYMRGFTVAILIQYQRFGHRGNLRHLFRVLPPYYLRLIRRGFPNYHFQYKTLFAELSGIMAGFLYYFRHRNRDPKIYSNDAC